MLLRLPQSLHYPIKLLRVEKRVGHTVRIDEDLFLYSYTTKVTEGSRYGEEEQEVDKHFVARFPSSLEGIIREWRVWEGDVLTSPIDVCDVEEGCTHAVQVLGMCANCGADMTKTISGTEITGSDRAPVPAAHDTPHIRITQEEAARIDEESKKRLLKSRKLSLVVDLDQTIIHAAVDPTIAEWQKDKENPNYEAVKDVRAFQLIDDGPGMRGCWYYIKLRPGLAEFLDSISQVYEMHVYTMGTRQYAQQIANIVDPDGKYFGDRILSRDESGSMVAKNLERIFPIDSKMVVIIDDRGDVWKWSANLIRVTAFDFFVGIGDINSSFLPKKQEIQATPKAEQAQAVETTTNSASPDESVNGVTPEGTSSIQNGTSALEQLLSMTSSDDPIVRDLQTKGQEDAINSQLEEKPLLKMQLEQDERDEAEAQANATATGAVSGGPGDSISTNGEPQNSQATDSDSSDSSDSSTSSPSSGAKSKGRHSILKNDDEELIHLENRLRTVHSTFFEEFDRRKLSGKGGRVAALAGKRKAPLPATDDEEMAAADLLLIPDIKQVMPNMKMRVLAGVKIVFSGVLPLGTDIQNADISIWAKTFGAVISDKVTRDTTHVIAARAGTAKVKQAVKRGVKVVGTPWLIESMQQWRKLDERPYLLPGVGKQYNHDRSSEMGDIDDKTHMTVQDFLLSSSEGESGGFDTDEDQPVRKKLKLNTSASGAGPASGSVDDFIDEGSPLTINQDDWDDIDAEFKEFMGSEAESESDNDSVNSGLSFRQRRGVKRRRGDGDTTDDGQSDTDSKNPSPQKNRHGGSALKTVSNALAEFPETSGAPTSNSHGQFTSDKSRSNPNPEDMTSEQIRQKQAQAEFKEENESETVEDSDDELERELQRELENADSDAEKGLNRLEAGTGLNMGPNLGGGPDDEMGGDDDRR